MHAGVSESAVVELVNELAKLAARDQYPTTLDASLCLPLTVLSVRAGAR